MAHAIQRIARIPVCMYATRDTNNVVARYTTTIWLQPFGESCTDKAISWHIRIKRPAAGPRDLCLCHRAFRHPHLCQTPPPLWPAQAPGAALCPILPQSNEPIDSAEHILFSHVLNTLPLLPGPIMANIAAGSPSTSPCASLLHCSPTLASVVCLMTLLFCGLCCIHHDNYNFWA
jgi:hypothetical protein